MVNLRFLNILLPDKEGFFNNFFSLAGEDCFLDAPLPLVGEEDFLGDFFSLAGEEGFLDGVFSILGEEGFLDNFALRSDEKSHGLVDCPLVTARALVCDGGVGGGAGGCGVGGRGCGIGRCGTSIGSCS